MKSKKELIVIQQARYDFDAACSDANKLALKIFKLMNRETHKDLTGFAVKTVWKLNLSPVKPPYRWLVGSMSITLKHGLNN